MYSLSEHALERVKERLTISPEWVLSLLEKKSVEVTCNEKSPRRHRVFWSIPDEGAFVAVVNIKTGEVITVYSARRDDLSFRVLTDVDAANGEIHVIYARPRIIRAAMLLSGINPPKRTMAKSFDKEFVARFMTRDGQSKNKIIGRAAEGEEIDDVLPAVIERAAALSALHGNLGLTIELRYRKSFQIIQEWVIDEPISYGIGE